MGIIFTAEEFVQRAKKVANEFSTIYIKGCFGAPMTPANKTRYTTNNAYNRAPARSKLINSVSQNTFGFDCVCLIKGLLWGWKGDTSDIYGGARYKANGVPDFGTEQMLNYCSNVSDDFTNIQPGCVLHNPGHVGIYIGDGLAVECTARWKDGVQITAVANLGTSSVNNSRTWQTHGQLEWIEYEKPAQQYLANIEIVKKGSKGNSVKLCQTLLNDVYGIDVQLEVDGVCGTKTVQAINDYQEFMRMQGIELGTNGKNDGTCGRKCWESLLGVPVVYV